MASIKIVSSLRVPANASFTIAVFCRDDDTAAEAGLTCTYRLYDPVQDKWWNATTLLWVGAAVDNALAEFGADIVGLYSANIAHVDLSAGLAEMALLFEVGSNAVGTPNDPTDAAQIEIRNTLATLPITNGAVADPVETLADLWRALMVYATQNRVISDTAKTLTFMQQDGSTPAMVFDLKDAADQPSVREIFKTERT